MKAVVISHYDLVGGAAISAYRLHRGLLAAGVESTMLVRDKRSDDASVVVVGPQDGPDKVWLGQLNAHLNHKARAGVNNTGMSLPWPGVPLADHPLVREADVVNLHWVPHFVSPESLRDLLGAGKPVIWTLHDQRAFTGACHYAAGCEGFLSECASCPQLQPEYQAIPELGLRLSLEALAGMPAPTIVAPSRWLAGEAKRSRVFAGCRVETVPYGIDLDIFKPADRRSARTRCGLPQDALVMMFGAYTLREHRKGFDLLSAAIHQVLADPVIASRHKAGQIVFAAYGKDEETLRKSGLSVTLLGHQETPEQMALTLSAADLLICPTREDNLPNVVIEAMACGVPVLASRVGGVPDMITDGEHGRLVPPESSAALAQALVDIISDPSALPKWGAQARAKCETEYPLLRQGKAYATLFQSLLAQPLPEPCAPSSLVVVQTKLLNALAQAQGLQVAALQGDVARLSAKIRETRTEAASKPTTKGAIKIIEQELKKRGQGSAFRSLSPAVWALRKVRKLLREL